MLKAAVNATGLFGADAWQNEEKKVGIPFLTPQISFFLNLY